jgi:hypothetical protein
MSKSVETGHAKNVATFKALISTCKGFGKSYKPSNPELTVESMTQRLVNTQVFTQALIDTKEAYHRATSQRERLFAKVPALAGRVVGALTSSKIAPQTMDHANSVYRKIRGRRAKAVTMPAPATVQEQNATATVTTPAAKTISVSQLGFDNMAAHLTKLVAVVEAEPKYRPNEPELSVETLKAALAEMESANEAVRTATTAMNNALTARNQDLYAHETGLVSTAALVKAYVKSAFGLGSPEHKKTTAHQFTKLRAK